LLEGTLWSATPGYSPVRLLGEEPSLNEDQAFSIIVYCFRRLSNESARLSNRILRDIPRIFDREHLRPAFHIQSTPASRHLRSVSDYHRNLRYLSIIHDIPQYILNDHAKMISGGGSDSLLPQLRR
jgi:hypothetical protein